MYEEMTTIEKNITWEFVDMPKEKKVTGVKYVYLGSEIQNLACG